MSSYSDPFGFTKQTSTLLRGLGASELIVECKKRNISTDVLHELTVQELIMLGTDPKKAEELKNCLNVRKRRSNVVTTNVEDRIEHFLEIIKQGEQQFCLIQAFIAYCRLRIVKERINIFIDPNKCLSASKILPIAVAATLTELEEANKNVSELEELILRLKIKPKRTNRQPLCIAMGALGLVTLLLSKMYISQKYIWIINEDKPRPITLDNIAPIYPYERKFRLMKLNKRWYDRIETRIASGE